MAINFGFLFVCNVILKSINCIWTASFGLFDKTTHHSNSSNALFAHHVSPDRRLLSRLSFQQFICLLPGIDAPWSGGMADGDSPGAFERIWSRWIFIINLHLVQEGFNCVEKNTHYILLTVVIFCTSQSPLSERDIEQLQVTQSLRCDFTESGMVDAAAGKAFLGAEKFGSAWLLKCKVSTYLCIFLFLPNWLPSDWLL